MMMPPARRIKSTAPQNAPALAAELFKGKPGSIAMAADGNGYVVGELKEILPAEAAQNQAEIEALRQQLHSSMANDQIDQYLGALRKRYDVKIFPAAVESLVTGRGGAGY